MSRTTLTLVQMNDTHAYLDLHPELFWERGQAVYRPAGGYARLARLVQQIRAETGGRVLFLDSGDTLHGTYVAVATQGQALVPILRAMGVEGMTAHWEFAYGPRVFQQRVAELGYPMLAVNVYQAGTDERVFPPYMVKEVAGLRIGVVGIASNIVDKTMPPSFSEGVRFTQGRDELPAVVETLRTQEHVDLVVLLSHLGFPQDMQLLSEVQGIAVDLSGHTHNRLYRPARQGDTLVVQAGSHGSFLTRLDLEVEDGRVRDYRHALIEVNGDVEPDPEVADLVRAALAPYPELREVVGETERPLHRGTVLEAPMDNLLLHALLDVTDAQIAFSNGWRYGAPVLPGPVTLNDLYNMVPMNPPVSTVELTGEEMLALLEENMEHTFAGDPYCQMGGYLKRALGLKVYFKIENPAGCRVQAVFVGGEPLRPEQTYRVAFVTEQGVAAKYGRARQRGSVRAVEALRGYLQKHRPLRVEEQGTFVAV